MSIRRFEFKDSRSYKFWEVSVEGSSFTVRYGKVGTDGVTQTKTCASPEKAAADATKKLNEKVRKGYAEVGSVAPAPPANQDSAVDWSVRADALQAAGDPWGLRIALSIARDAAKGNDKRKLTKELDALSAEHGERLFGAALVELMAVENFEKVARLTWEYGYITKARISTPDWDVKGPDPKDVVRAIVQSPAAAHLRDLTLGLYDLEGGGLEGVGQDITSGGELPALERLFLGDFSRDEQEISWVNINDISPIYALTPKLNTLRLQGANIVLGELEHPTLARLEIESGGLPLSSVASLANAKLPALAHMEVWFGCEGYGGTTDISALQPMFTSKTLPKLKHLGLQNSEMQDAIAIALANSPLLAQVESVNLSMGTMREAGARAILTNAGSFKHLKSLDLDRNYIPNELCASLRAAFGAAVNLGRQQTPDMYDGDPHYYTSVSE